MVLPLGMSIAPQRTSRPAKISDCHPGFRPWDYGVLRPALLEAIRRNYAVQLRPEGGHDEPPIALESFEDRYISYDRLLRCNVQHSRPGSMGRFF